MIKLSVNLNKVCLLRNARGSDNPSPSVAATTCLDAGASGITLHWRADNRHTREDDVRAIRALCAKRGVEFNLEGDARVELIDLAAELVVDQFTLVPVTPGEVTSDHGWELPRQRGIVAPIMERLARRGVRTAVFMDPEPSAMAAAADAGARRVEIYTEPYAAAFHTARRGDELERVKATARAIVAAGMEVNAGHDLDLRNLPTLAREVPEIAEASIGHALLADALHVGLGEAVARYVAACRGEDVVAPVTR
jgi:pyridoxine 5-phosphate synthase